jgi:hypothetical protein
MVYLQTAPNYPEALPTKGVSVTAVLCVYCFNYYFTR